MLNFFSTNVLWDSEVQKAFCLGFRLSLEELTTLARLRPLSRLGMGVHPSHFYSPRCLQRPVFGSFGASFQWTSPNFCLLTALLVGAVHKFRSNVLMRFTIKFVLFRARLKFYSNAPYSAKSNTYIVLYLQQRRCRSLEVPVKLVNIMSMESPPFTAWR